MTKSTNDSAAKMRSQFLKQTGIQVPILAGAMYPCSNPELVAAVSEAGGIGILQPISLIFVYKNDFRDGIRKIRSITSKPIGMNVLTEQSSQTYIDRMKKWVDIALEEGVRYFVTSLGNPKWIVDVSRSVGGVVYHDVTDRKWAIKAVDAGVHGLICVNNRAGGHAGAHSPEKLIADLQDLNLPLICAGGVCSPKEYVDALKMGYAGVQMGTRFIATEECRVHPDYKAAILKAHERDIVLTDRISGVPVAVIRTPYIERVGTRAGLVASWMLRHPKLKHWMRAYYSLQSIWQLKKSSQRGSGYQEY
ncbi:MAG: nitronate monooxygenase, partial [Bdellovibrionota bacterium]